MYASSMSTLGVPVSLYGYLYGGACIHIWSSTGVGVVYWVQSLMLVPVGGTDTMSQ